MRLKMTTKLGFKQPKFITSIHVTNDYPGGYWEDLGYNWFGDSAEYARRLRNRSMFHWLLGPIDPKVGPPRS